jgi:hypothetical protein
MSITKELRGRHEPTDPPTHCTFCHTTNQFEFLRRPLCLGGTSGIRSNRHRGGGFGDLQ